MAQEEHIPSSSHSGGGGVSSDRSRNVKQKKVQQRGLGVAQLEKIRLEEQRKKEGLEAANANSIGSVNDAIFHSPNTVFRSSPSIPVQIIDRGVDDDTNLQSGNDSWSRFWSGDCSHSMPQRSFIFHQPVVNPSTVLTSCMEPPSNQNIHGSNYASLWPEVCKMVGMKRSYPFSIESPPERSFPGHFDPASVASKSRSDELPSCNSGYTEAQREARNIDISFARDDQSNSTPLPKQSQREEVLRNDKRLNGDFLTLAPPAAASNPNHTYRVDYLGFEGPEQNTRNKVQEPFDFFPARSDLDEAAALVTDANRENGETIDLNLKL